MRYDKDFAIFAGNTEWYEFKIGEGYVPTNKAPKEAIDAMHRYNENAKRRRVNK